MSVPRSLDGFDVIGAVERMLDQPELWWQAVGLFVEHFADWDALWQACIGNDMLERKRVHAVRSAAANVGALQLANAAGRLEDVLLKRMAGETAGDTESLRAGLRDAFQHAWRSAANAWQTNRPGPGGRA
jgi:HPt (histidine-containing phosphotransfer) domain-containing protein